MAEIDKTQALELVKGEEEQETEEENADAAISRAASALLIDHLTANATKARLEAKEWDEMIGMRREWSEGILGLVTIIVYADIIILGAVGVGFMTFTNNLTLPFFIGESVIKTIGLALIIVGFLFNRDSMGKGKEKNDE